MVRRTTGCPPSNLKTAEIYTHVRATDLATTLIFHLNLNKG